MGDKNKKWKELFGTEEWNWILRLGAAMHDPEAKKIFWETVKSKKESDPSYCVFTDFPKEPETKKFPGAQICADILETLKGHKKDESA